jgi:hypothetical protein
MGFSVATSLLRFSFGKTSFSFSNLASMKKDVNELQKKLTEYETKLDVLQKDIDNDTEPKAKKIDDLLLKLVKTKSSPQVNSPVQSDHANNNNNNSHAGNLNRDLSSSRTNIGFSESVKPPPYVGFEHLYLTNFVETHAAPQLDCITSMSDRYWAMFGIQFR